MRALVCSVLLLGSFSGLSPAQTSGRTAEDRTPQIRSSGGRFLSDPYRPREVSPVSLQNSGRIFDLIRAGQLYLSLDDAIALALENNLDIELQRFLPKISDTDLLRARGGGLLRGLSLLVNEAPPGIGGPDGPLVTNLTAGSTPSPLVNTNFSDIALISQQQNNLSITGVIPMSNGPAIPQFDPVFSGQVNTQHVTTPENSTVLSGSNWLAQNEVNANAGLSLGFSTGAQLGVNFDNSRYSTDATRYTYNPFVNSSFGLTVTQPLLQGFGASLNNLSLIHI